MLFDKASPRSNDFRHRGGAMSEAYSARWRKILNRLKRFTGDPAGARDILQSALLRAEEAKNLKPIHNFEAYVSRTATNIAIDERRRELKRQKLFVDMKSENFERIQDSGPLQDEAYEIKERLSRVKVAIGRLPPRCREALLLHRLSEMKYGEIATYMGISQSAVERLISRAMQALARSLQDPAE
jgi:RNA polymerase sigma factor (sigma-70 family)